MSTIQFLPCIKVLNLMGMEYPLKVTTSNRGKAGGSMWWKYASCIPTITTNPTPSVSISNDVFGDRFTAYLFSQTFFTIHMYNKMSFQNPLKYYVDECNYSFYYFLSEGEILTIPLLHNHPSLSVMMTQFNNMPVLKISIKTIT